MNIGLIGSFVLSGILALGIAMNNQRIQTSSNELLVRQLKQSKVNTLAEIVSYDISKIGYNINDVSNVTLTKAEDYKINFFANIDNSEDGSLEEVKWEWLKNEGVSIDDTENPNDFLLFRSINGVHTDVLGGVVEFVMHYYDEYGQETWLPTPVSAEDFARVKQISVKIIVESESPISTGPGKTPEYVQTSWEKRFSPINLRDNN